MTHRLTIKQIAEQMRRSRSAVTTWARVYRWPHIKLGRIRLYDMAEVENHMKQLGFTKV